MQPISESLDPTPAPLPDDEVDAPSSRRHGPSGRAWLRGLVAGAVALGAGLLLVGTGTLTGLPLLAALGLLVVAVPSSRELSRRVLIGGTVTLGFLPMLWWVRLPVGDVGHAGLLVAALLAVLVGWVAAGPLRGRARLLVPRVRWSDGAALFAALVATWVYLPTLRDSSPGVALTRFLRGWDHSAHFDMAAMILKHGVVIGRIEPGGAGQWSYADYPQGFHAVAATVMEALLGSGPADPGVLVVTYARSMTLVVLVAVVTVVAGLCSLPSLRRRPLIAFPAALFVIVTFTLGPGGMVLHDGFPNFLVACAMLACLPLVAIQMNRPMSVPLLAAFGGAALGVAHNWSLLLSMGALAGLAVLFPLRRRRWPSRRVDWVAPGAIVLVTGLGMLEAVLMLRRQPALTDIVVVSGGVTPISVSWLVLTAGAALAACGALVATARTKRGPWQGDAVRTAWTGVIPLVGGFCALLIVAVQLRAGTDVGYYFWKYAIALQMVAVVVLVAALSVLVPTTERRRGLRHVLAIATSLVLGVAALQVYGLPKVLPTSLGAGIAPGAASRADYVAIALAPEPAQDATTVLDAAAAHVAGPDVPHVLLPLPATGAIPSMMMSQWFNALTGRWTDEAQELLGLDQPVSQAHAEAVRAAREVLGADPDAIVVVGPEFYDAVRAGVQDDGWSDRVSTW